MHSRVGNAAVATAGSNIKAPMAGERHHALDLIRGLAALSVSQYHFMNWNGVATVESMGTFAVYVFFILSGLTMMMVYGDRFADGVSPVAVRSFFRKRGARLLPLLMVVAVLSCAKQAIVAHADIPAAILTGTGLLALQMPGFLSNSVGAWSLGIELAFYAVFPIVAMLARSWKSTAIVAAALIVAQHLLIFKIKEAEPFWNYYISNLVFAPFFALGILISFDRGARKSPFNLIALLGLAAILSFSLVVSTDLMRDQVSYFVLTIACGLVVWAAWRSTLPAWLVPVGAFLGDISYSLYLTHWIVNDVVRVFHPPIALQWTLFTFGTLLGSYLCYRFFEAPMRDRLGSAPRLPMVASQASVTL